MKTVGFLVYFALGLIQILATVDGVAYWTGLPGFLSWIIALAIAYIPLVGTIAGYLGALNIWGWEIWQAALLFFGGLGTCILLGLTQLMRARRI